MGWRPTGMRTGSLVNTPDSYVLALAKISRDLDPAVVQIFFWQNLRRIGCRNKPSFEKSQNNTDHIFSADSSNCLKLTIMSQPPNPRRGERLRKYLERSQLLNNARSVFAKLWRTIFSWDRMDVVRLSRGKKRAGIFEFEFHKKRREGRIEALQISKFALQGTLW